MAQLAVTAGRSVLGGLRSAAPALARGAANAALGALYAPHHEGPRITELAIQTSTDGAPMPRLWGRARIAGQVIWASRYTEHREESGGGKGGPTRADYTYSISFAVGLCEGEIAGIGRIWANGSLLDQSRYPVRVHTGAEDQLPDALIQAVEGADAPAFRGTAYAVLEDWPLDAFGHRIPNLSFEVFRRGTTARLETQVRGVSLIPGAGEFACATTPVMRDLGDGEEAAENVNNSRGTSDIEAALDDLERDLPACRSVQLVVCWFGTSLDCSACEIRPGVEDRDKVTRPLTWTAGGADRATAWLVSREDGRPVYGGTPSDDAVIEAIAALKARGFAVTLYPFILMDMPGRFPWRGQISCSPAPDTAGSVDGSAIAGSQVDAFFGTAAAGDFSVSSESVAYAGPAEWRFNRFILHCAALAKAAGGVDGFLIGSEMVGLTTVRDEAGGYPAVDRLCALASEARSLLGAGTRLSYAADWTEYSGHQPSSGEKLFHLDPLWSHPEIDAVAIDFYIPLSDWRDTQGHLDAALASGPHDAGYLAANIAGGEGYDWYYADLAARDAQARTLIADGAYGEDWIWRVKDLAGWWSNPHHDRPGGVRAAQPTAWVPKSKPIWLTEVGCPAVDKGANQPNVFVDPKSEASALPHYTDGSRDDLVQRRYLEAMLAHWLKSENNPVSPVYGGPMVEPGWMHVWAFDSRPFPDFPARSEVWGDGENWRLGHWLNGRAGLVPVADIVSELGAACDLAAIDTAALDDLVAGYLVDRPMRARDALAPLAGLLGISVRESTGGLVFASAGHAGAVFALPETVWLPDRASRVRRDPSPLDLPRDASLAFLDDMAAYRTGHASAHEAFGTVETLADALPVVADGELARRWCTSRLDAVHVTAARLEAVLPPSALALEPGDRFALDGQIWTVAGLDGLSARAMEARSPDPRQSARSGGEAGVDTPALAPPPRPDFAVLDLPLRAGESERAGPLVAARAIPWPGAVDIHFDASLRSRAERAAVMGNLLDDLPAGPAGYWDEGARLTVRLPGAALSSRDRLAVLNGANRLAVEQGEGRWEVIAFADVELVSPGVWALTGLLRGLDGTRPDGASAGARAVLLDAALAVLPVEDREVDAEIEVAAVAAGLAAGDPQARMRSVTPRQHHLEPLAPVHLRVRREPGQLRFDWIRRTRIGGDDWTAPDVPLGEDAEHYTVTLSGTGAGAVAFEVYGPSLVVGEETLISAWGSLPATLEVSVAQHSALRGAGAAAIASFDL